jgi:hypothetical protein
MRKQRRRKGKIKWKSESFLPRSGDVNLAANHPVREFLEGGFSPPCVFETPPSTGPGGLKIVTSVYNLNSLFYFPYFSSPHFNIQPCFLIVYDKYVDMPRKAKPPT